MAKALTAYGSGPISAWSKSVVLGLMYLNRSPAAPISSQTAPQKLSSGLDGARRTYIGMRIRTASHARSHGLFSR